MTKSQERQSLFSFCFGTNDGKEPILFLFFLLPSKAHVLSWKRTTQIRSRIRFSFAIHGLLTPLYFSNQEKEEITYCPTLITFYGHFLRLLGVEPSLPCYNPNAKIETNMYILMYSDRCFRGIEYEAYAQRSWGSCCHRVLGFGWTENLCSFPMAESI